MEITPAEIAETIKVMEPLFPTVYAGGKIYGHKTLRDKTALWLKSNKREELIEIVEELLKRKDDKYIPNITGPLDLIFYKFDAIKTYLNKKEHSASISAGAHEKVVKDEVVIVEKKEFKKDKLYATLNTIESMKKRFNGAEITKDYTNTSFIDKIIPLLYKGARLNHTEIKEWAEDNLDEKGFYSPGIIMCGPTGTGKTYNLMAMVRWLWEKSYTLNNFFYIDFSRFTSRLKMTFGESQGFASEEKELLRKITGDSIERSWMFIDDMGATQMKDYDIELWTSIIDSAQRSMCTLVITTNIMPNQFEKVFGPRLASRLGIYEVKIINGNDKRK